MTTILEQIAALSSDESIPGFRERLRKINGLVTEAMAAQQKELPPGSVRMSRPPTTSFRLRTGELRNLPERTNAIAVDPPDDDEEEDDEDDNSTL